MLQADSLLDQLMLYIEDNQNDIEDWTTTFQYTTFGHPLFRTTRIWAAYSNLLSHRTLRAVQPFIGECIDLDIIPVICKDLYIDIQTKYMNTLKPAEDLGEDDEVPTDKDLELLELLRKAVANLALHRAIPHLRITFESNALLMVSSTDGMNIKQPALDTAIASLSARLQNTGKTYMGMIQKFLVMNIDDFPILKDQGYMLYPQKKIISSIDRVGGILIS
jgi:hypothetical protein